MKRAILGNSIPRSASGKPALRVWHQGGKSAAFWSVMLVLLGTMSALARADVTVTRVSENAVGEPGSKKSFNPSISADGRFVAFSSAATNLVPDDTNMTDDVFVKNIGTGEIVRVSEDAAGMQGNDSSGGAIISADGRFVSFSSSATNLVPGETNDFRDVFVKTVETGEIARVSEDAAGVPVNRQNGSAGIGISADGRFVAFWSRVQDDTQVVFVKNLETGELVRVNENAAGELGNNDILFRILSADGSVLAFESNSSNLVPGDTNNSLDIFVKNIGTGEIKWVSEDAASQGNGSNVDTSNDVGTKISISADGRLVAFYSIAVNLVPGDTNMTTDVFVKNLETGEIVRVSEDVAGMQGNRQSGRSGVSISADGRFVAFSSSANNLVSGDTNENDDVFVKNLETGEIVRVSEDSAGEPGNSPSNQPSISSDGRFVAFSSIATNLVPGDKIRRGLYVKNVETGAIVEVDDAGRPLNPGISADYRFVAFESQANNLVAGDTNDFRDVFLAEVAGVHAPTTPGNLRFAVYSRTAAEVFWNRSSGNGDILYEVIRNGELIGVLDALSVFEDNLQSGVGYTYVVTAIDDNGIRSATATVSFTTIDTEPSDTMNPPMPGNLRFLVYSDTAAEVFWDRPVGQAYLYRVYFNGVMVVETDGVSWWSEDFTPGSTTEVMVVAVDSNGAESSPAVLIVQTSGASLSPVTGLRAEIYSATAAEIFWDRMPGTGHQYRVYADGVEVATTDGTSWFSDDFEVGSSTEMTVVSFDGPNESVQQSVTVTTRGGNSEAQRPPILVPAITGLHAAVYGKHFAEVFWDRPTDQAYSYRVFFNRVLEVETDGISWWSRDFAPGSTTEVAVIAVDNQGAVSPPATVIVQTPGGDIDPGNTGYEIGDTGPGGGIVFSVNEDGTRGLEASLEDLTLEDGVPYFQWGCFAIDVTDVSNLNIFPIADPINDIDPNSGELNTQAIFDEPCDTVSPGGTTAAQAARGYEWPDGQTVGYLPNRDELHTMYDNIGRGCVQATTAGCPDVAGFGLAAYWSSSEFSNTAAWFQNFGNGDQFPSSKGSARQARAIRAF